ncbi:hypothetical protein HanHA300_Chr16g0617641 [Helianthus annuus]|nr:hypothetical protein HanHA300_Chr16g0617641 [Helianthus annuus]KAJ0443636.1 hypothetical protein HanIR_Chr16g0822951 [Helianthus annuus]KAJ0461104.1 hypothetical protein HanHA89_Chr16g0668531 [Helianthus annuus]KAJ0641527.1 hypothetical protein HanLR1_Chr16g0628231 [Helianthus annuus]KAJ0645420.1 hypothetical protein HanOQP8_Chr16g0623701 [Helianthus annuus]
MCMMAESQKTDAPVKSKEKSSSLDIDIDKDFFGSWKSTSMGDDGMDFDFEPPTKGKQKAFKFGKMDMDFSLDADFDKLSSFKMDMPGLDISSATKKSGKSTEKSKEASSGRVNQSKRGSFGFSFDFDGFADLGFESKKTKTDENSNKDVDASEDDDTSLKHPATQGVTNSRVDTQTDNFKDPDPRTEDVNLKSVIDESSLLKAANSEEQGIQRTIEPIQESPSSEKRYSPEPVAQKIVRDSYVHSEDTNICTEGTFSDVQEEESKTLDIIVSPSTGDEQNDARPVADELVLAGNFSAQMEVQSDKGEMCVTSDDNVTTEHNSDTSKADLHLESYVTHGVENLVHEEMADERNADSDSEHPGNIPIRSKYFIKQNGSESELQQASASSTKLISISNKKTNTLPNPALEKRDVGSRSLESGSKLTGLSRSLPKVLNRDIPVQAEKTEASHVKSRDNTREAVNAAYNLRPRSESTVSTVARDVLPMKEKPVSKGNDQINAHRSDVQPSSSIETLRKNISLNIINPGRSTHNMKKTVVKENKISPTKAEMKASEAPTSRVSRPTELKPKPLNSLLPKKLTSMGKKDQCPELQGNTVFKRNLSVDTKKQTPPTPTLKRKAFEVDIPRLTPLKRLSASPCSNKITASSEKAVEERGYNHTSVAHAKSPRLDVSLKEMDISLIENDGIFEKAEACSKELEDICNMLKKKHEEANDLLVRAIVNNNHLLMLNHPIYQDKISMVQKFAELLITK